MADYSKWPERRLNVSSLLLDARNPRIPPGPAELSQRQLIEELIEHDNVYDLARDIATSGFDPSNYWSASTPTVARSSWRATGVSLR